MAANVADRGLRQRWTTELERERTALADEIKEIKQVEKLLSAKLKQMQAEQGREGGRAASQPGSHVDRTGDPGATSSQRRSSGASSSSGGSAGGGLDITLAPEQPGLAMLQLQEFLSQQRGQLKRRAKEIKRTLHEWRVGIEQTRGVTEAQAQGRSESGSDSSEGYSSEEGSLRQTFMAAVDLSNRSQADSVVALSHALALLAERPSEAGPPREGLRHAHPNRAQPEPAGSSLRQQGAAGKENRAPGGERRTRHAHWWLPAGVSSSGASRRSSIASLVAPIAPDRPPLRAWAPSPPPSGLHRTWAAFQAQQASLIRDQSDWLRSFKERLAYGAGPYSAAPPPLPPLRLPSVGGSLRGTARAGAGGACPEVRIRPDPASGGASIMLDDHTELKISLCKR
eukprot:jgi/Tetstr1/423557/TSEL_014230.t1